MSRVYARFRIQGVCQIRDPGSRVPRSRVYAIHVCIEGWPKCGYHVSNRICLHMHVPWSVCICLRVHVPCAVVRMHMPAYACTVCRGPYAYACVCMNRVPWSVCICLRMHVPCAVVCMHMGILNKILVYGGLGQFTHVRACVIINKYYFSLY